MIRVFRTTDLLEAEILRSFLHSQGIEAEVFDRETVRQDWFRAIALGGYRVMVADEVGNDARALLKRWQAGEFALDEASEDIERVPCVACGSTRTEENPWPRRLGFLFAYMGLPLIVFRWQYRCCECGAHWRASPRVSHAVLTRKADEAAPEA